MKSLVIVASFLAVGSTVAFWVAGALPSHITNEQPVKIERSEDRPASSSLARRVIRAVGYVEPVSEIRKLTFKIDGVIEKCRIEVGQQVEAGEVLATLRNQDENAAVLVAEEQLAVTKAERDKLISGVHPKQIEAAKRRIAKLEEKVRHAQQHYDRQKILRERNTISATDYDQAETELRQAQEELKEALAVR